MYECAACANSSSQYTDCSTLTALFCFSFHRAVAAGKTPNEIPKFDILPLANLVLGAVTGPHSGLCDLQVEQPSPICESSDDESDDMDGGTAEEPMSSTSKGGAVVWNLMLMCVCVCGCVSHMCHCIKLCGCGPIAFVSILCICMCTVIQCACMCACECAVRM